MSKNPDQRDFLTAAQASAIDARALDKFYTNPDIARECVRDFESWTGINLATAGDIMEPSAGAGAFLDALPAHTRGYDIAPEDARVRAQDFLKLQRTRSAIVIGNPPFGKRANLAVRFFNHAAAFASHIAFILPRTFEKDSIVKRLDRRFHLVGQRVLPRDSFTLNGAAYSVPSVFQVWERRGDLRPVIDLSRTHPDFDFTTRELAEFAIQRVGARAGAIKTEVGRVAASSHYFLRASAPLAVVLARFRGLDFAEVKARSAGNPSIAKTELVALYSGEA